MRNYFQRNIATGLRRLWPVAMLLLHLPLRAQTPQAGNAPLPEIHELMRQVQEHQRQLDKVRENYTYTSLDTVQDLDSSGRVTQTKTTENEDFFVNSHMIERAIKKDGKPLDAHEEQKETERVTKQVEKAQKTPPGTPIEGLQISISRILELMDVRNPRRENNRGRSTIVFDFIGRKDAKTHGLAEDVSKKLQGTLWVDEADRQVAHLEVSFDDAFHIAGGLVANVQKGSNFRFDQAPVESGLWLPTGGEGTVQLRVLLVKAVRQHFFERDYDFKRFHVEAQPAKEVKSGAEK